MLFFGVFRALIGDEFFVFGGYICHGEDDGTDIEFEQEYSNDLFALNLRTLKWRKFQPATKPLPVDKTCLCASDDGRYLYTFGGYGDAPEPLVNHPLRPLYKPDVTSQWQWPRGWHANLCRFDLVAGQWEWIQTSGCQPEPRAGKGSIRYSGFFQTL